MRDTFDADIARAVAAMRAARGSVPPDATPAPDRPQRTDNPRRHRRGFAGGWTTAEIARLIAAVMLGLMVGATWVLAGGEAGAWLLACVALTTKYMGEIVRTLAFAALGFVAGLAKGLQAYADGKIQSPRIVAANICISMIFGVLGGIGADGFNLDPKLGFCVAFVFGIMTFGSMKIIEDRLRK